MNIVKDSPITQAIGGNSYTLHPLTHKDDNDYSLSRKILLGFKYIVFVPIIIIFILLFVTPIMLFGPRVVRHYLLSRMIPRVMAVLANKMKSQREKLLRNLEGKILDVGAGGGAYFVHYTKSKVETVVAIEPLIALHETLNKNALQSGLISTNKNYCDDNIHSNSKKLRLECCCVEEYITKYPEECGTFDWIIFGNVLCEVSNTCTTLQAVDHLLKPGGYIYFCEHVGQPKGSWSRLIQNIINPWWVRISGGCNCNRDTLDKFQKFPSWDEIIYWRYEKFLNPFILGLIRKAPKCK